MLESLQFEVNTLVNTKGYFNELRNLILFKLVKLDVFDSPYATDLGFQTRLWYLDTGQYLLDKSGRLMENQSIFRALAVGSPYEEAFSLLAELQNVESELKVLDEVWNRYFADTKVGTKTIQLNTKRFREKFLGDEVPLSLYLVHSGFVNGGENAYVEDYNQDIYLAICKELGLGTDVEMVPGVDPKGNHHLVKEIFTGVIPTLPEISKKIKEVNSNLETNSPYEDIFDKVISTGYSSERTKGRVFNGNEYGLTPCERYQLFVQFPEGFSPNLISTKDRKKGRCPIGVRGERFIYTLPGGLEFEFNGEIRYYETMRDLEEKHRKQDVSFTLIDKVITSEESMRLKRRLNNVNRN